MEYRTLGGTGLKVSVFGVGAWQLSGPLTLDGQPDGFPDLGERHAIDLIHGAGELGINLIDTAEIYGAGEGERRVGKALRGQRDRWILSSKFGLRRSEDGRRVQDASPETIRSSLENSLRRLQTEYLDLYLYHTRPERRHIEEGKRVLDTLKQEGKLRFYGISTNSPTVLRRLMKHRAADVVMLSRSLITQPDDILALAERYGLGILARGALESGKLSGRYFHTAPQLDSQDFRQRFFQGLATRKYAVYEPLVPPGSTMTAFALRYLLDFDATHTIVLGGTSLEQYREALGALALPPLDPATHVALVDIRQRLVGKPPLKRRLLTPFRRLLNVLR